jgi:UDP:flavonoid glycosyltransferase YjiC (YdhE family)
VNLLVTVGREIDPATFGPQPANVRIERFLPQAEILPHVNLVVSHGGSGSVLDAPAHGRPMVVLPIGADQPLNAERIAALPSPDAAVGLLERLARERRPTVTA